MQRTRHVVPRQSGLWQRRWRGRPRGGPLPTRSHPAPRHAPARSPEIGRASGRGRGEISGVPGSLKKKKINEEELRVAEVKELVHLRVDYYQHVEERRNSVDKRALNASCVQRWSERGRTS